MYNYYIDILCEWYFGENHRNQRNCVVNKNLNVILIYKKEYRDFALTPII